MPDPRGRGGGDGRAEGSSATGDAGPAATSLTPGVAGPHACTFESSQLGGLGVGAHGGVTLRGQGSHPWI